MTNEFGIKLDNNGYAPSVIQPVNNQTCRICGRSGDLVRHEVFHGPNRAKSKALGCWVNLCPTCHERLHAKDPSLDWNLRRIGQLKVMAAYDWSVNDFRERFGKSYV